MAAIARAIADSLEVREVWDRVFDACKTIVPFDALGIVRFEPGGDAVRPLAQAGGDLTVLTDVPVYPRAAFSPRFWPDADQFLVRIDDAEAELDPKFAADAMMLKKGYRSAIRLPLGYAGNRLGSMLLSARERRRFTPEHAQKLAVVAELVTVALAHEQRATALAEETRRTAAAQERALVLADLHEAIGSVVRAISQSLAVREVWDRVFDACKAIVPFDALGIVCLEAGDKVRAVATAGLDATVRQLEGSVYPRAAFSPKFWPDADRFVVRIEDTEAELDPAFMADSLMITNGFGSAIRLPLGYGGQRLGSILLCAREKRRFTPEHAERLAVVAGLITVALAHEQRAVALADETRRTAAAQERAAVLADLHEAIGSVARAISQSLDVRAVWERVADACRAVVPFDAIGIVRLESDGAMIRAIATTGSAGVRQLEGRSFPRSHVSARYWPDLDRFIVLVNDVERELDMSYPVDKASFEAGLRSVIRLPLGYGSTRLGAMLISSQHKNAFTMEHAQRLTVVAELVTVALAHEDRATALADETRRTAEAHARAALLEERVQTLASELEQLSPHRALGSSRMWREVLRVATKVAPTDTTVLLSGESGTGKEVVARFIHNASPRKGGPFVALNCAALPEQLLESELFGHEKGAFTGALSMRAGKIEQAARGVLFLDEVGEMSPAVQAKFLRVLQEREFQRVGGSRTLTADVRVLAATNRDLKASIARGTFREDLYYRLAVFDIPLPPLRERREDIALLTDAFLESIGRSVGRPAAGVTGDARHKLDAYAWPGNVRELRNVIERAVILCEGGVIESEHLPLSIVESGAATKPTSTPSAARETQTLGAAERDLIVQALEKSGNNKSKAARLLGLTRAQLRSRIEKHGITAGD